MVDVLLRYAPPGPDGSQVTFRVSRVPAEKKVSALRKAFLRAFAQKHGGSPTVEKLLRCADGAVLSEAATLRGGGGVTWRGDAESHVLLRAVVSEAERARLEAIILALKDRGALRPNPSGPRRFFARYDHDVLPSLGAADADGPADLEGADLFATAANLFERAGGFVHRHTDAYAAATGGERAAGDAPSAARDHLRCNIALRLAHCDSLRPVIDRRAVDVDDGDAWAFLASKREHETTVSEAAAPRVVLGFGWALAA
ncbi:hypothetical protein JL721_10768 [Aureococcus anophagefferens]|nr:hypothetical protein JL721_10768 [Aureococcus anophagefferens]